jgi:hypothetical protein
MGNAQQSIQALLIRSTLMSELPFIYVCSHAGKIGNFRWVNSDTRWPVRIYKS